MSSRREDHASGSALLVLTLLLIAYSRTKITNRSVVAVQNFPRAFGISDQDFLQQKINNIKFIDRNCVVQIVSFKLCLADSSK